MFTRLKNLWRLSAVPTMVIRDKTGAPQIVIEVPKPRGVAKVVEMTDTLADFTSEKDI